MQFRIGLAEEIYKNPARCRAEAMERHTSAALRELAMEEKENDL